MAAISVSRLTTKVSAKIWYKAIVAVILRTSVRTKVEVVSTKAVEVSTKIVEVTAKVVEVSTKTADSTTTAVKNVLSPKTKGSPAVVEAVSVKVKAKTVRVSVKVKAKAKVLVVSATVFQTISKRRLKNDSVKTVNTFFITKDIYF